MPQRIQELLSALCADGGRLRHQHTRNMVRRLLQYVGLDALVLAVVSHHVLPISSLDTATTGGAVEAASTRR